MRIPGASSGRPPDPPPEPERPSALIGRTALGKYSLVRFLGAGSNADVYYALPGAAPKAAPVVVKRVKPEVCQNPRFRQFFDNEIQSMARFRHPYAVRLLDAGVDPALGPVLILDYIPGMTLEDILAKYKTLPPDQAARLACQLCHALHAAHKVGIVHRDLKPANLMVVHFGTKNETLKVMDFGFAGFTARLHIQLSNLTGSGQHFACGTPAYVSPEMIRGDAVDGRADLYAAGVILFEMLAGRLPFDHDDPYELLQAHVSAPVPTFRQYGVKGVPAEVEAAIRIALSKFPNERYQTAREFAEHVGRGVGLDLWEQTTPPGYSINDTLHQDAIRSPLADEPDAAGPEERFALYDQFEAILSERLAAAKLKGFIDDVGGVAVASDPGLVRVRIDLPKGYVEPSATPTRSGLLSWLSATRRPGVAKGREPVEMELRMRKTDASKVTVVVGFRPLREYLPDDPKQWRKRCEALNALLRKYVMAG
jgi:serine/threonine protein kinase